MITVDGKIHVKRYLAGFVPAIAQSIAFGIGTLAESDSHAKLQFEAGRVDVALTSFDFINNRLIYKAQLPDDFAGTIQEAAIFSSPANTVAGEFGSKLITTFDSSSEEWVDSANPAIPATFTSGSFSRIGTTSLTHTPAASGAKSDVLTSIALNLNGYSSADKFVIAYNVGTAFTSQISIRFFTNSTNYYTFNLGSQTTGYKITEVTKSSAVATGTPDWSNITFISVTTNSSGGGASQVQFDGIRVEDVDTVNPNYVMIAREVLPVAFTKQAGKIQEVEFALDVNVL